ncbi:MAG TPA: squalene/phytoene synthase family protein [Acetobacteraceae bacterium]|nr:squalene/phytoene synthase family protein [Acetobacteraceae bacterium]
MTEAPSRDHRGENFPVASLLLSRAVRPKVLAFYRFVRTADDVADHPRLDAAEKLRRLDALEAALDDPATTDAAAQPMHASGVGVEEARRMLLAFRQDAVQRRYPDWAALEDYCARSANPVGRMLLRLHGGADEAAIRAADALCTALQILNHLQDLVPDRERLDRIYLPEPWMAAVVKEPPPQPSPATAGEGAVATRFSSPSPAVAGEGRGGGLLSQPRPNAVIQPFGEGDAAPRTSCPSVAIPAAEAAFFDPARAAPRRAVLDAALDRVEEALDRASALPRLIRARRLALESAVTLALARRLLARLRAADPVVRRVALTRADFAAAFLAAPRLGASDAAIVRARVGRAGSSFARGMRALGAGRRRALWAVYAFCRAVDDIADATMPDDEKHRALAACEAKLATPDCALSRELARAREAHALPAAECQAMIAGMRADSAPRVRIADGAALDLYCRRVAGSVGAMAVRIFGAPEAEGFGLSLGRTLQLVNILRDLDEDAARERVYLPLDRLAAQGVADGPAAAMLAHPGFAAVARSLAAEAEAGFANAEAELRGLNTRALQPARIMMWGYRRLLDRLIARGFTPPRPRPRLTRGEKLRMALAASGLARLHAA